MINVLLAAALLCQDPEVSARVRKADGEYEMTITGKGPGLVEDSVVSLKFHRRVNRMDWNRGRIETVAADDAGAARACVEGGKFVHARKFARAGEIEVRIGLQREDWTADQGGCPFRQIVRVFRVSTPAETVGSLRAAARKMDATLHGAREILDDAEALIDDPCLTARRERDLRKRLEWRFANYRKEVAQSALSASSEAFVTLLSDIEREVEAGRGGKSGPERVSELTGEPFSWEQARHWLEEIETVALMERGLLLMKELDTLRGEIAIAASAGERWDRAESGFRKTLEGLRELDRETRSGRLGDRFAPLAQGNEFTLPQALDQLEGYLQAAASAAICPASGQDDFERRTPLLQEMIASLEDHFRSVK